MNKQSFITILLIVLMSMTGVKTLAHDIEVKNSDNVTIYYAWANEAKTELAVSHRGGYSDTFIDEYTGNVVIPGSVNYNKKTYPVTSIGYEAFALCDGLTSVTIPQSVTSIGAGAFCRCGSLASITIPNSVTSIGEYTFSGCSSLTSVTIPTDVTFISYDLFNGCSGLTSITIPNSVTGIAGNAFNGCSNLKTVSIGSVMTVISFKAFANCSELTDVYCLAEKLRSDEWGEGLYTDTDVFNGSNIGNATLHVPAASLNDYKNTEPWKYFNNIVAIGDENIPETPKCAKPTISLVNGRIQFNCDTEGVQFVSSVTVSDAKTYYDSNISAPKSFKVIVYAIKNGYEDSETATAEFNFSNDTAKSGDVDGNGEVNVADHVKLSEIIMNQNK